MRVAFYQPTADAWDFATPTNEPNRIYQQEMTRRMSRWGHEVVSLTPLADPDADLVGPDGVRWLDISRAGDADADVWFLYGNKPDDFPPTILPQEAANIACLFVAPRPYDQFDREKWERHTAVVNAIMYREVGGNTSSTFRGKSYRHPNHFTYFHPWEMASRERWLNLTPESVFVDIGCSIGSWTLPAAALGAKVYAFDPGTDFSTLRRLVAENGFYRVEPYPYFISDTVGTKVPRGSIPWHSVDAEEVLGNTITMSLDTFALKHRKLDRIDLIKIDIDGGEREALAGMEQVLRRLKPEIIVETHTFLGVPVNDVIAILEGYGYRCDVVGLEEDYYFHVHGVAK